VPRVAWILLGVAIAVFVVGLAGAALLIAGGSTSESVSPPVPVDSGAPRRLELPLADDPNALMLARRSGTVLVGIAVRPDGPIQVAAVDGEQAVPRDSLSFRLNGRSAAARPCGYACWQLAGPARGRLLAVELRNGATMRFGLPLGLPADGRSLYRELMRTMGSLRSYRYDERLTSGVGKGTFAVFEVQPPDRMRVRTADGFRSVIIRDSRWDYRDGRWERSSFPGFRATFMWDGAGHARILNERLGRKDTVLVLAVYDREPVPAWFKLHVSERTNRVLEAEMLSPSHFMHHRYGGFNRPLAIRPPA
jgi:hypothetical protein